METIRLDLAEVLGWGYVMEHCISSFLKSKEEQAYRSYVTDVLKMIAENTAAFAGGSFPSRNFSEIYKKEEPKQKQSAQEIKDRIKSKFK